MGLGLIKFWQYARNAFSIFLNHMSSGRPQTHKSAINPKTHNEKSKAMVKHASPPPPLSATFLICKYYNLPTPHNLFANYTLLMFS